jgi:hypothetical protein
LFLRSERAGRLDGRVYRIAFEVDDGQGGSVDGACAVTVPHDRSGAAAVDSGPHYCVGRGCGELPGPDPLCRD